MDNHTITVAEKELTVNDLAVAELFKNICETMSVVTELQAEFINKAIATLSLMEQQDLLKEIEDEEIFSLKHLVTT